MKSYIIGITGAKNTGKDVVASMINYIFTVGATKANYHNYVLTNSNYSEKTNNDKYTHFDTGIKDVISIIYNIPRFYFDDKQYTDNMYYNIKANTFVNEEVVKKEPNCEIVTIDRLRNFKLNTILSCTGNKHIYIKLCNLIQYFGNNICSKYLADDIWIKQTISKAVDIAKYKRLCIIPDVKYNNEVKAIQKNSDSLYGGVIKIKRGNSEQNLQTNIILDSDCDYIIYNNNSFMNLFYNVLNVVQSILDK